MNPHNNTPGSPPPGVDPPAPPPWFDPSAAGPRGGPAARPSGLAPSAPAPPGIAPVGTPPGVPPSAPAEEFHLNPAWMWVLNGVMSLGAAGASSLMQLFMVWGYGYPSGGYGWIRLASTYLMLVSPGVAGIAVAIHVARRARAEARSGAVPDRDARREARWAEARTFFVWLVLTVIVAAAVYLFKGNIG